MQASISFEIEVTVEGEIVPYVAATRWDPPEGGFVEDAEIIGLGAINYELVSGKSVWKSKSLLNGVDLKAPAIQRLFDNILQMHKDEIDGAIMEKGGE